MLNESRRVSAVQPPIIPVVAELIRANPGTISLGQGVVGYAPPPEARAQVDRFLADPNNHKYQSVAGVPALLTAIQRKLSLENGIAPSEHEARVMVTAGGNQGFLNAVLAIADPGDEIILPTPYYFNQEMAITLANCRPVLVPTDGEFQLDVDALRAAISPRTRAIVTVSPNNPSGAVYPAAVLQAVNELCAAHGVYHISDEAYEYFTYNGARHFSAASLPGSAAHTISLFSMSKAFGFASWRIGWMVYPANLDAALRKIQDTLLICPPVVSQYAAVGALEAGRIFVDQQRRGIAENRAQVQRELLSLQVDGIGRMPPADGAFYYLFCLNTDRGPLEIATELIQNHRVAVIPGNAFGLESGCHLRVAYGALDRDTAAEGISRLARGLRTIIG